MRGTVFGCHLMRHSTMWRLDLSLASQDIKALSVCLVLAYCIWDEANYQKCYFRAELRGQLIRRDLFPTFRHIENPPLAEASTNVRSEEVHQV